MTDDKFEPARTDGFIATTTSGLPLLVGRAESGRHNDVRLGLGGEKGHLFLELLPSHARELAKHLVEVADALDNDYPDAPNR